MNQKSDKRKMNRIQSGWGKSADKKNAPSIYLHFQHIIYQIEFGCESDVVKVNNLSICFDGEAANKTKEEFILNEIR